MRLCKTRASRFLSLSFCTRSDHRVGSPSRFVPEMQITRLREHSPQRRKIDRPSDESELPCSFPNWRNCSRSAVFDRAKESGIFRRKDRGSIRSLIIFKKGDRLIIRKSGCSMRSFSNSNFFFQWLRNFVVNFTIKRWLLELLVIWITVIVVVTRKK